MWFNSHNNVVRLELLLPCSEEEIKVQRDENLN